MIRTAAVAVALAALLALSPGAVPAATTYSDSITGAEYFFTSTEGRFAGKAYGDLPGYWNTVVDHTPLAIGSTPTATITGGNFELTTTLNSVATLITGDITGGTINVINASTGCTDQVFEVDGTLAHVGPWFTGSGSGTFSAQLTHHRVPIFGHCVIYAATVSGTLSLSF
jgi:tetrahydromethanopterin S-methyltransferase subunit E